MEADAASKVLLRYTAAEIISRDNGALEIISGAV
jgi:hypothetical protein